MKQWRNLALATSILLVGCASTVVVAEVSPRPESERRLQVRALVDKTVALIRRNPENGAVRPYCSGVWVSPTAFISAGHCVDEKDSEIFYTTEAWVIAQEDAIMWPAKVAVKDEIHDLSLTRVVGSSPSHSNADVSLDPIWRGDQVQTMGQSVGMWYSYSTGTISAIRRMGFGGPLIWWIQSDAAISPGNSGCGLWDYRGELIGTAVGSFSGRAQNVNLFIHRDHILEFLRDHQEALR